MEEIIPKGAGLLDLIRTNFRIKQKCGEKKMDPEIGRQIDSLAARKYLNILYCIWEARLL